MDDLNLPELIGGRYRPLRVIGRGGMGVVYEVEHVRTGEQLALKLLTAQVGVAPEIIERFKREARASSKIKSEHVVRVTDADVAPELNGAPFLVMDLLEGTDLEQHAGTTPQKPADVLGWMRDVGRAMTKAHAIGIIHRDLKPENLFLAKREDGSSAIKILDFGIAKMSEPGGGGTTQTGSIMGTPRYMSPEQAKGETAKIGPTVDIWAIGMIAFRLLSARHYWKGETVTHIIAALVYEPIAPPSTRGCDAGPAFDTWFQRSCNRDPDKRFASVKEQIEALEAALAPAKTIRASAPPSSDVGLESTIAASDPSIPSGTLGAASTAARSALEVTPPRRRAVVVGAAVVAVLIAAALSASRWGGTTATSAPTPASSASPATSAQRPASDSAAPVVSAAPLVTASASAAAIASASASAIAIKPGVTATAKPKVIVGPSVPTVAATATPAAAATVSPSTLGEQK